MMTALAPEPAAEMTLSLRQRVARDSNVKLQRNLHEDLFTIMTQVELIHALIMRVPHEILAMSLQEHCRLGHARSLKALQM